MLKTYIGDCQSGKREAAAMSCIDRSLDAGEKEAWRSLRKDLQSVGITPDLYKIHRQIILNTIQEHLAPDGVEGSPIAFSPPDAESLSQADRAAELPYEESHIPPDWEPTKYAENLVLDSAQTRRLSELREFLESGPHSMFDRNENLMQLRREWKRDPGFNTAKELGLICQFLELRRDPGDERAKQTRQAVRIVANQERDRLGPSYPQHNLVWD